MSETRAEPTHEDTPSKEGTGETGWDTPGRGDQERVGAQPQHPRSVDAERAEGGTDTVERDHSEDAATGTAVKDDAGEEGWGTQSGVTDDDGAPGQD